MRVGEIRTLIEDKGDEELVFAPWFDKDEADEYCVNNLEAEEGELTKEEWELVVNWLSNDDGIWNELYESLKYYVGKVMDNREKGEANDDSK